MKKAKIILTCVAILAVIGGAFAFKASRFQPANIWYIPAGAASTTITTTLFGGLTYSTTIPNCTLTDLVTTNVGSDVATSSSTTSPTVLTSFTRLVGTQTRTFVTTYHYCTLYVTKTAPADF